MCFVSQCEVIKRLVIYLYYYRPLLNEVEVFHIQTTHLSTSWPEAVWLWQVAMGNDGVWWPEQPVLMECPSWPCGFIFWGWHQHTKLVNRKRGKQTWNLTASQLQTSAKHLQHWLNWIFLKYESIILYDYHLDWKTWSV